MCKKFIVALIIVAKKIKEGGQLKSLSTVNWINTFYIYGVAYYNENKWTTVTLYNTHESHENNAEWKDIPSGFDFYFKFKKRQNRWF